MTAPARFPAPSEPSASGILRNSPRPDYAAARARREGLRAGNDTDDDSGQSARALREHLLTEWPRLLRQVYRTTAHAAVAFERDDSTIRKWLADGPRQTLPDAEAFARALVTIPGAAERLLPGGVAGFSRRD